MILYPAECGLLDARHEHDVFDHREAALLVSVGDDRLRFRRTDARQRLERLRIRSIDIDQSVIRRRLPFEVISENPDPFWSEANQRVLRESIASIERGEGEVHEVEPQNGDIRLPTSDNPATIDNQHSTTSSSDANRLLVVGSR